MKRIVSILLICLSLLSVFTLSACGVEGSSAATGVKFTKETFYVDLGIKTHLDYKVYPSSAKNYAISFNDIGDYSESSYYTFDNGWILVNNRRFTELKVSISLNNYTHNTTVKLRKYPSSISFESGKDIIFSGAYKTLQLEGIFDDGNGSVQRFCENGEFNYKVTTSDPSVISVEDSEALLVKSTGKHGESEITVNVLNGAGEKVSGLEAKIILVVKESIADAVVSVGNYIVKDGVSYTYVGNGEHEFDVAVRYFSQNEFLLEDSNFYIISDNEDAVEVIDGEGVNPTKKLKFKFPEVSENPEESAITAKITMQSKEKKEDGLPYKIVFHITLQNG